MELLKCIFAAIIAGVAHCNVSAGPLDRLMESRGYVDIAKADTTVEVSLMYATPDNFVGKAMYKGLEKGWLHPDAAQALKRSSLALREKRPDLHLKVYDASRPMSVQKIMYNVVKGTSKAKYVSNPANGGGLHNYGLAVDVTLCDSSGKDLDMGTPIDFLGSESNIDREEELVKSGKLTRRQVNNRKLLREVMKAGGYKSLKSEWWHFNLVSRPYAREHYRLIDF